MPSIVEALARLDPGNDNHWTSDGLPRIDTMRLFTGDAELTRSQITIAAPRFTRSNVVTPEQDESVSGVTYDEALTELNRLRDVLNDAQRAYIAQRAFVDTFIEQVEEQQRGNNHLAVQDYKTRQEQRIADATAQQAKTTA